MESGLESHLDDTMKNTSDAMGILFADSHGLSLGCRGTLTDRHAGVVTELARHASKLSADASDVPVICLESEAGLTCFVLAGIF
uniref:ragulator complex protein LAMTOR5 isoform X2 n=1 Tax=Myxine glutinosa TaxID=7769 RepID=UPI00358F20D5